jgi:hypothetical protein
MAAWANVNKAYNNMGLDHLGPVLPRPGTVMDKDANGCNLKASAA